MILMLNSLLLIIYLTTLGAAVRAGYNHWRGVSLVIKHKTDFFAHSFFQGLFFHVLILNCLQWTPISANGVRITLAIIFVAAVGLTFKNLTIKWQRTNVSSIKIGLILTCLLASIGLFLISYDSPNLAWDSWLVWEQRAWQWLHHGLNVSLASGEVWNSNSGALYNSSAHYPEAMSLLYYTALLLQEPAHALIQVVTLYAYAMLSLLMLNRMHTLGADKAWLILMAVVLYSIPFINNHLILAGYADLWVAMYIAMVMLTMSDYNDQSHQGMGLTLLCYLLMLPLLKLEGWVWLLLILTSHGFIMKLTRKGRMVALISIAVIFAVIGVSGGFHWETPFGDLILQSDRVSIFQLLQTDIKAVDISPALAQGFMHQNNWSLLWFGLPLLFYFALKYQHDKPTQVSHLFLALAVASFVLLFTFTKASQWALDMTAMNRIVLQLVPCYVYLLFNMMVMWPRQDHAQIN